MSRNWPWPGRVVVQREVARRASGPPRRTPCPARPATRHPGGAGSGDRRRGSRPAGLSDVAAARARPRCDGAARSSPCSMNEIAWNSVVTPGGHEPPLEGRERQRQRQVRARGGGSSRTRSRRCADRRRRAAGKRPRRRSRAGGAPRSAAVAGATSAMRPSSTRMAPPSMLASGRTTVAL